MALRVLTCNVACTKLGGQLVGPTGRLLKDDDLRPCQLSPGREAHSPVGGHQDLTDEWGDAEALVYNLTELPLRLAHG